MSPALLLLAGAVVRPRARRPTCEGSRLAMAAACVCAGSVVCPCCRERVDARSLRRRAVELTVGVTRG